MIQRKSAAPRTGRNATRRRSAAAAAAAGAGNAAAAEKRRGRSVSSSSAKSSEDEEEMKEFLLSTDMPEDQMLVKMMGFSAFDSTKGKDHSGADLSDVKRATKRQYRQYMNRRG